MTTATVAPEPTFEMPDATEAAEIRARLVDRIRAAALLADAGEAYGDALDRGDPFFWDCMKYGTMYLYATLDWDHPTPKPEGWFESYSERRKGDPAARHRWPVEEAAASAAAAWLILDNVTRSDGRGLDLGRPSNYDGTLPRIVEDVEYALQRLLIEIGRVLNQSNDPTFVRIGEPKED